MEEQYSPMFPGGYILGKKMVKSFTRATQSKTVILSF